MKPKRPFQVRQSLAIAFTAALLANVSAPQAFAKTITWTGGGTNPSWNQAANWGGDSYVNGDDAVFGNTTRLANYTASGKTIKSITFTSDAPGYTIAPASNNSTTPTGYVLSFIASNTGITVEAGNNANHSIGVNSAGAQVGSISLNGDLPVTHNGNGLLSLTRPVGGSFGIIKSGPGTLRLASSNSYSGTTTINGGKLRADVSGSSANSEVILNNVAATFSVQVADNIQTWSCAALTAAAAGTIEFDFGTDVPNPGNSPLTVTGLADFTAATPDVNVIVSAGPLPGVYPLATWGDADGTIPATENLTISTLVEGTSAGLSVTGNTLNLVITGTTPGVVKADNTDDLNLGSSWVGNMAPTADEIAIWDSTVTSANTTVLGADSTWAGISIEDPVGPVTINAGHTLTLGAAVVDLDLSSATADLTLNCPLVLAAGHIWDVTADRTLTLNGVISGPFPIVKQGAGTAVLAGLHTYTGSTTISAGTLRLAEDETLPFGSGYGNIFVGGTLDLAGKSQPVNGLTGTGIIDNLASGTTSTLTVGNNNASATFGGTLRNSGDSATLDLVKTGSGTFVLGGASTMTGSVTVQSGTLAFTNTAPLANASGITLAGGTTLRPDVVNGSISAPITVGATATNVTINAPSIPGAGGTNPVPVTLSGPISGDGNVRFVGIENGNAYGRVQLNATSTYAGTTLVTTLGGNRNIFVRLGVHNALPATTVVNLDGGDGAGSGRFCEIDLNGRNQALAGLTNNPNVGTLRTQRIRNTSATPATLTIHNTGDYDYAAQLGNSGTNLGLTKSGPGTQTFSGTLAYAGDTTVNQGTLVLGNTNANNDESTVAIAATGATLELDFASTDTVAALFIGGVEQALGIYGAVGSPEPVIGIPQITGTGTLTVAGLPTAGYAEWAATNAGGQGPELDFDGDGVANGVEFFLNAAPGFTALPTLDGANTITWTNGGNIPASAYGTQFVVQTSDNLVGWFDVPAGNLTTNTDGPDGSLTYTLTGTAPRFVRLKVMPE